MAGFHVAICPVESLLLESESNIIAMCWSVSLLHECEIHINYNG